MSIQELNPYLEVLGEDVGFGILALVFALMLARMTRKLYDTLVKKHYDEVNRLGRIIELLIQKDKK